MMPGEPRRLAGLDGRMADVVVLRAGVNGAGLFRDLCAQGLCRLIVEG